MRAVENTKSVPGDTAEIGCASGGTSRLIALLNGGKTHWACDTFRGLVDVTEVDTDLSNGKFFSSKHTTLELVSKLLADLPNARVRQGIFPDGAPVEMLQARYSMLHLDVDTYSSMKSCFKAFAGLMSRGGVMVLDDVIGRGTRGGKRAWAEILAEPHSRWRVIEENDPQAVIRFS